VGGELRRSIMKKVISGAIRIISDAVAVFAKLGHFLSSGRENETK
jgi:hypothetical protein